MINTQIEINKLGMSKNCKYVKLAHKRELKIKKSLFIFSLAVFDYSAMHKYLQKKVSHLDILISQKLDD